MFICYYPLHICYEEPKIRTRKLAALLMQEQTAETATTGTDWVMCSHLHYQYFGLSSSLERAYSYSAHLKQISMNSISSEEKTFYQFM